MFQICPPGSLSAAAVVAAYRLPSIPLPCPRCLFKGLRRALAFHQPAGAMPAPTSPAVLSLAGGVSALASLAPSSSSFPLAVPIHSQVQTSALAAPSPAGPPRSCGPAHARPSAVSGGTTPAVWDTGDDNADGAAGGAAHRSGSISGGAVSGRGEAGDEWSGPSSLPSSASPPSSLTEMGLGRGVFGKVAVEEGGCASGGDGGAGKWQSGSTAAGERSGSRLRGTSATRL